MTEAAELHDRPVFERGDRVRAVKAVRNDGTYPGAAMGEVLIEAGDMGYVHSVGTYLNRFYIYGVEFVARRRLVGMRAQELAREDP